MAKIRIYELARELNMTNKELLEKLAELDISASSHMSSLDDNTVSLVKTHLVGKPEPDLVETRVKPTVIRRRKRAVTPRWRPFLLGVGSRFYADVDSHWFCWG